MRGVLFRRQMKELNKKKETRTEQVGSLKKRELCKGHNPHDYVLVLPEYIKLKVGAPYLNAQQIEQYYLHEESRKSHNDIFDTLEEGLGIEIRRWKWDRKITKYYRCARCGKKKYE